MVKENKVKNHGSQRNFLLKHRYAVDPVEIEWRLLQQDGLCAICHEAPAEHVDHDHVTKRVRGVLCFNCNRALGYFGDDVETLYKAADYLTAVTPR